MGVGAVIGAAIGAAASIFSADKQAEAQREARQASERAQAENRRLQEREMSLHQQQQNRQNAQQVSAINAIANQTQDRGNLADLTQGLAGNSQNVSGIRPTLGTSAKSLTRNALNQPLRSFLDDDII